MNGERHRYCRDGAARTWAQTVGEFWNNLVAGKESIATYRSKADRNRRSTERIHRPNYVRRTAEMPDMQMFDAEFFGMSPKKRPSWIRSTASFSNAPGRPWRMRAMPDTEQGRLASSPDAWAAISTSMSAPTKHWLTRSAFPPAHTGNDKDFLSTRASFCSICKVRASMSKRPVQPHWSPSLCCQSLLTAGAPALWKVTIELPHGRGYLAQEGEILSPDGHCRPFDHRAQGTVFGSGVEVVVLRRLQDARMTEM